MADEHSPVRGVGAAHDQRRRDILEAVFSIVDSAGADQVSIRHVAEAAGVSVGRVQHYFPSKDALLTEAFAAINDLGTRRVQERLAAEGATDDPRRALHAILAELIPHTDEDRTLFRVAQAFETYALTRPSLKDRVTEGYDQLAALLALLLRSATGEHATEGSLRPEAHALLALAIGLSGLTLTGNLTPREAGRIVTTHLDDAIAKLSSTR
ncbi:TetR family transcriptional regulator [Herbihabitans rhizosphaerae]|uniref:TetR family transcriptional regulator n=1 Tax=Herbihabitans rhizosphaerae TaxID=1872711 RepID=A0A4Q7L6C5_9PSEU|nr:TetR/AcrR family transcriptional regulator [Herbihabitans rhizosphaerae]RZS44887.1 TetR family transcriptional regulator [Herbihabitans rhizosphaerae]